MTYKRGDKRFKKRLALKRDRINMAAACVAATLQFEDMTEEDINSGSCFDWATIVFDYVAGSKIAGQNINDCGHTWVEFKGRCYDAEVPQGVRNWLDLPFWKRLKAEAGSRVFNQALRKALA
jgi:hypothetical protein